VASLAGLMQPNYQGRIFDSIVVRDRADFEAVMVLYLGFQVKGKGGHRAGL
jgi:hypothetical protein